MTLPLTLWRGLGRLAGPLMARRSGARLMAAGLSAARAREKRGIPSRPRPAGRLIWVHAASVGESLSILPVVDLLTAAGAAVVVTTGTATSAEILGDRLPAGAIHQFAPLDSAAYVRRFLRHWRPDLLVTVESELWPDMLTACDRAGIPRALVNARLSPGSLRNWGRFPATARRLLGGFALVTAQTDTVAQGLTRLGARDVTVPGDLKAAGKAPPADDATLAALRAQIGDRPIWAAVSTHPGEDAQVLAAHAVVRAALPDALLILCPRHPGRGDAIAQLAPMTRRSLGEAGSGAVYLADTLGETGLWYRLAPVTFLGGSFAPVGGHNPWEAARCGTAILHGPAVPNAAAAYRALDAARGAEEVTEQALGATVAHLLTHRGSAQAMATAAAQVVAAQSRPAEDTATRLLALARTDGYVSPMLVDPETVAVIAPNFKKRWSGVSSTVIRLVPLQVRDIAIAAAGPRLPPDVPQIALPRLLTMSRGGPQGQRVWHARRNIEMLAGLVLKTVLRKRLKLLFTSASQRRHTGYTRWLIGRMDHVVATSAKTAAFLERPATVIRHGIDLAAFAPPADRATLRRDLGLAPDAVTIGCFGRIRHQKGTDLFVDAMIALLPSRPGHQAVVMGGTTAQHQTFLEDLQARVRAAGLQDRIRFLPEVPGWEVARWFQAMDLYVAPQRREGFGLTPLEAMACGAPVIATTAGAFEELVAPDDTGLIVPAGDGDALRDAIAAALDDPARRARWAANAPAHVAADFTLQGEADALTAIYRRLLAD